MKKRSQNVRALIRKRERLLSRLPDLGEILRGTVVTRFRRCGRPSCHCAKKGDPGHGPAYYLMVTVGQGQTIQVYIPKEDKEAVEQWVSNFKRARQVLEEISRINRGLLKEGRLFTGR